jgi:pimeloyl-ACP methyl ester carboxylesterase
MARVLYLHGFASSPASRKAQLFRRRFEEAGIELEIPYLEGGSFRDLTIGGQLRVIEQTLGGEPAHLIGSSMGGYLAALYAARHPEVLRLVLMAPAFGFARRWATALGEKGLAGWRETGTLDVYHYAAGGPTALGWGLMEDALRYEDEPAVEQPALVWHGLQDDVVPVEASRSFVGHNRQARLVEVTSNHELTDVAERIAEDAVRFLPQGGNA